MPVRRGARTTQSGAGSSGSGSSWSAIGVVARPWRRRCSIESSSGAGGGVNPESTPKTSARTVGECTALSAARHLAHRVDERVRCRGLADHHVVLLAEPARELGRHVELEAVGLDRLDDALRAVRGGDERTRRRGRGRSRGDPRSRSRSDPAARASPRSRCRRGRWPSTRSTRTVRTSTRSTRPRERCRSGRPSTTRSRRSPRRARASGGGAPWSCAPAT